MSSAKDFVIENGVLTKYDGGDAEVIIPDGVTTVSYTHLTLPTINVV